MKKAIQTSLVSLIMAAIVGGAVGGVGAVWWMKNHPATQRIAVVNIGALAQRVADSSVPDSQDVDTAFRQSKKIGAALAKKGYIVFDAGAVIDAPDVLYTPSPVQQHH